MALELLNRADGRVIPLKDGTRLCIGRAPQVEIHIADQAVSRRHCVIDVRGAEVTVTDLKSANGTYVNERAVHTSHLLAGDLLRAGSTIFEVRLEGGAEVAPPGAKLGDDSTVESVISRRFEPTRFSWLEAAGAPSRELELLRRAQRHLSTLHMVAEQLAVAHERRALCDVVLRSVLEVTGADRGALLLKSDAPGDGVELVASRVRQGEGGTFTVSRTLVTDVIHKGVSTFAHDAVADERYRTGRSVVLQHVRSVMCVPLRTSEDILGALYVDTLSGPGRFSEADLELLAAVGNQAGIALHRVRLLGDLERLFLDTIRAIAATIDAKDGYTHRHSERVAAFARRIAAAIGLSAAEQDAAEWAALLHDVGKIAVPDSILNKPDRLSTGEFEAMKQHPSHGARILENIKSSAVAGFLPGVKYHHERWDGTGYPEGLRGKAIPVLGRLLAVADFLDALTSARTYRQALSMDETVRLVEQEAGSHFDPDIARAVIELHRRGELAL